MPTPADQFAEIWRRLEASGGILPDEAPAGTEAAKGEAERLFEQRRERPSDLLDWAGNDPARLIAAGQVIENFYRPLAGQRARDRSIGDELTRAQRLYTVDSRLNENPAVGQVILRRPLWGRWSDTEEHPPGDSGKPGTKRLARFFDTLLLLPASIGATNPDDKDDRSAQVAMRFVYNRVADGRALPADGRWRIGFIPLAQSQSDIDITYQADGGRLWYDARAVYNAGRVEDAVRQLCEQGCHIIALPELAVEPQALIALSRAVRRHGARSQLVLVLAGTTRTAAADDGMPRNRATILGHRGNVILTQDKMTRWNIMEGARTRLGLAPSHADGILHERITPGEAVTVAELTGVGRLVALICEDLSRSEPGNWLRSNMLLDLQFTPVFDSTIEADDKWEICRARETSLAGVCRAIVANSMPLTHHQNAANAARGLHGMKTEQCGIGLVADAGFPVPHYKVLKLPLAGPQVMTAWDDF
jgi:predicted amidohydrolase